MRASYAAYRAKRRLLYRKATVSGVAHYVRNHIYSQTAEPYTLCSILHTWRFRGPRATCIECISAHAVDGAYVRMCEEAFRANR